MDLHGFTWIYMDLHGLLWICMDLHGFTWIYMDIYIYTYLAKLMFFSSGWRGLETLLSVVVDTFYKETMTIYVSVDCKNIQKPIKIHQTAIQNLSKIHQKPFNMYQNPSRMDLH